MEYKKVHDIWSGLCSYNLTGKNSHGCKSKEDYAGPVTLSLPQWQQYVGSGLNTLYGSGGVIPGGVTGSGWTGAAVYKGHVRQGWGIGWG